MINFFGLLLPETYCVLISMLLERSLGSFGEIRLHVRFMLKTPRVSFMRLLR